MLILLFVTFILVYFSPNVFFTRIIFLSFLPIIYFSKKDYFWLAWLFTILDAPGYLFKGGMLSDIQRIPAYPILPSISITFFELTIFVLLLKVLIKKDGQINHFPFQKEARLFIALLVIYTIYTFLGFEFNLVKVIRVILPWTFVYIILKLLRNEDSIIQFSRLIFPVVFFTLLTLVFYLREGIHLANIFKENFGIKENLQGVLDESTETAVRSLFSVFISFFCVIASFVFLYKKKTPFPRVYLISIIAISILNALLTATRGYLLSILFITLLSILFDIRGLRSLIRRTSYFLLVGIGLFAIIQGNQSIKRQIELSIERNATVLLIFKGDYSAGGTLSRLNERIPKIRKEIQKNPLLGFGFSDHYFNNFDGDVGFFNTILNVGYLGLIILYGILISIIVKIFKISSLPTFIKIHGRAGYIFIFGLLGMQIYHFTTNVTFGLAPAGFAGGIERYFIYGLILAHYSTMLRTVSEHQNYHLLQKLPG